MANIAMKEINNLKDQTEKAYFIEEIYKLTGLRFDTNIKEEIIQSIPLEENKKSVKDGLMEVEESILAMMLNSEDAIITYENELGFLLNTDNKMLSIMIVDYYRKNNKIDSLEFIESISDEKLKQKAVKIIDTKGQLVFDEEKMKGYIDKVIKERYLRQINHYQELIDLENDQNVVNTLFEKMEECIREARKYENGKN